MKAGAAYIQRHERPAMPGDRDPRAFGREAAGPNGRRRDRQLRVDLNPALSWIEPAAGRLGARGAPSHSHDESHFVNVGVGVVLDGDGDGDALGFFPELISR